MEEASSARGGPDSSQPPSTAPIPNLATAAHVQREHGSLEREAAIPASQQEHVPAWGVADEDERIGQGVSSPVPISRPRAVARPLNRRYGVILSTKTSRNNRLHIVLMDPQSMRRYFADISVRDKQVQYAKQLTVSFEPAGIHVMANPGATRVVISDPLCIGPACLSNY
jgi:hypothetical protein